MRIHLIYPHGPSVSCPNAIGRHLAAGLSADHGHTVFLYDWDQVGTIRPRPGDVLLGHPHPNPLTIFRRSLRSSGWRRTIALSPFNTDPLQMGFADTVISRVDAYLAITGNYWHSKMQSSLLAHWAPKLVHVDLAVDRSDFPQVKAQFAPVGERRFVYIGHSGWQKNPEYLEAISAALPGTSFSWIGGGSRKLRGYEPIGRLDFANEQAREVVRQYDFLLTVGKYDANPATILEAMSWGLIPICTPESGYSGYPSIINVPLDDVAETVRVLTRLQKLPPNDLLELQARNYGMLSGRFSWERFVGQVANAIEDDSPTPPIREDLSRRLLLRAYSMRSPYNAWRPDNLAKLLRRQVRQLLQHSPS